MKKRVLAVLIAGMMGASISACGAVELSPVLEVQAAARTSEGSTEEASETATLTIAGEEEDAGETAEEKSADQKAVTEEPQVAEEPVNEEKSVMDQADQTVTVTATETVSAEPDKASVSFGVQTDGKSAEEAQEENSKEVDAVIGQLEKADVNTKDIQTTSYYIYPSYGDNGQISGYSVTTTLTVSGQDIDKIGELISEAVAAGANNVSNINYSSSTYDDAYNEALSRAVDVARGKAEVLSRAAGYELGEVVSITEQGQDMSARYKYSDMNLEMQSAKAADVSVMPGELNVNAMITVTYRMTK